MQVKQDYKPYLAGAIRSIIFGFSFMFIKILLKYLDMFTILSMRFILAAIVLTILYFVGKLEVDYKNKNMKGVISLSILQPVLYFIFESTGLKLISSTEVGIIMALAPVVVIILSIVFLKETPSKKEIFFIGISISAVLFIAFMNMEGCSNGEFIGYLSILLGMICFSSYNIVSRKLSTEFSPTELTFVMTWIGAISFTIISLIYHGNIDSFLIGLRSLKNMEVLVSLICLGVVTSVFATLLEHYTLSKITANQSIVFSSLTTVVSILVGVFILGESFHWYEAIGSIVILIGVWGTNYYGHKERLKHAIRENE